MNWEAIGAIGEIVGAIAVVATLAYLAVQVKYAKSTAADTNRLMRAAGVREMSLALMQNDEVRRSVLRGVKLEEYFQKAGNNLDIDALEAERLDYLCQFYFWLHWGQYKTTSTQKDMDELKHLIASFYTLPGINYAWNNSPLGKPMLDDEFVAFVDAAIEEFEISKRSLQ